VGGSLRVDALVITVTLLHAIGGIAWAALAVGVISGLVSGLRSGRLLELQLAHDPELVRTIVQQNPSRVRRLRRGLLVDYGFLVLYWLTFVAIAVAISRREGKLYDLIGVATALAATATAALDVVENIRTRGLLSLSRPSDQVRRQPVEHLRRTSLAKWFASAATLALVALLFLPGGGWVFYFGIALLCVAAFGAFVALRSTLVSVYFLLFFAVGVAIAAAFTFSAESVVRHL
jgi:hypothetical protein